MSFNGSGAYSTYAPLQFNEYIIFFEGSAITSVLTGAYLVIAGTNIYLLRRKTTFNILLLYTIMQLALITIYTALRMYSAPGQALAIFDIADPESTDLAPDSLSTWSDIIQDTTFVLNTCLSDAFLLYRCYHIVRLQNKHVFAFPALLYLATVGSSLAWLVVSSFPGASLGNHTAQLTGKCYLSLSAATNICASCLITVRLWMYRRAICDVIGSHRGAFYLSYIAMTLESALLYTVFAIITLIVSALNSPLEFVFVPALCMIQVIAPSLIIYRIARGISFEVDEYGSLAIGSIRFASSSDRPHTVPGTYSVHQDVSDDPGSMPVFSSGNSAEADKHGLESYSIHEVKREV